MRILVTGSAGTLGVPLVRYLREAGHEVWGCDLLHGPDAQYRRCDIGYYRQLEQLLMEVRPDLVYNLAAEFGRHNGEDYFEQCWRTNVIGTRNLLELQRRFVNRFRVILFSSSEVYGEVDEAVLDEALTSRQPIMQPNDYAISKWVNEVQAKNFQDRFGSEIMRVRLFNAYGPGEFYHPYRSVVCLFVYRALHGIPFDVYDDYYRVFMYVDDLMPTLTNLVDRFRPGAVYNIGGTEYRSVNELADIVLDATGGSRELIRLKSVDAHNRRSKRPDIRKAVADLGHSPTVMLEEGVPRTVEWMRQVYGVRDPVPV